MPTKQTIKEIKEKLQQLDNPNDPFIQACQADERKGVQTALKQWERRQVAKQELLNRFERMSYFEQEAQQAGYQLIAGIDEVGRGPLAGPVVAAAVVLDPSQPILGLDDSKKLSLKKRLELFALIQEQATAIGIGVVDAVGIDHHNILGATKIAMKEAVSNLTPSPDFLLIDAVSLNNSIPSTVMNQGDAKSNSIAAASIIAKVTRDNMMKEYGQLYPGYGFKNNAGYGTQEHLNGLQELGPSPIHRHSFAPVRKYS